MVTVATSPVTIIGLFEDRIDAEDAILAMRRNLEQPDQVSLLIRSSSHAAEGDDEPDPLGLALAHSTMNEAGGWLQGLTSVIVPERGTYLVAGPLGAALAGIGVDHGSPNNHPELPATAHGEAISLLHTFVEFGFGNDEASYLEHRLAAGAVIVALTSDARDTLQASRRLFADYNAVHIGQARTSPVLAAEATALLTAAPETLQGDVIVADSVTALSHLCSDAGDTLALEGLCGADVIDMTGRSTGTISDLLGVPADPEQGATPLIRYVVVTFGGLLGLGRNFVAIPGDLVDLTSSPVQARVDRETIHRCPRFNPSGPLSRRIEAAVFSYFGTAPYWE